MDAEIPMQSDVFPSSCGYTSNMFWMDRASGTRARNHSARNGKNRRYAEAPSGFCTTRKEVTMSNQSENEMQQTPTPEEVRQHLLTEIEASKQTIEELSEEELEQVAGGRFSFKSFARGFKAGVKVFDVVEDLF